MASPNIQTCTHTSISISILQSRVVVPDKKLKAVIWAWDTRTQIAPTTRFTSNAPTEWHHRQWQTTHGGLKYTHWQSWKVAYMWAFPRDPEDAISAAHIRAFEPTQSRWASDLEAGESYSGVWRWQAAPKQRIPQDLLLAAYYAGHSHLYHPWTVPSNLGVIHALRRVLRRVLRLLLCTRRSVKIAIVMFHRLLFSFAGLGNSCEIGSDGADWVFLFPKTSVIWEDPYLSLVEFQWTLWTLVPVLLSLALIDATITGQPSICLVEFGQEILLIAYLHVIAFHLQSAALGLLPRKGAYHRGTCMRASA